MDFELTKDQIALKEMVRKFTEKEIRPKSKEWDDNEMMVPKEIVQKYEELGLLSLALPEKYGGLGLTAFEVVLVIEEIASVSPVAAFPIFENGVGPVRVIELFGTEEQRQKYLPKVCKGEMTISVGMTEPDAGTGLTDLQSKAVLEGDYFVVNGQKRFVSGGGHSEAYLVYVRLSDVKGAKGIGGLLIEKGTPGFTFGKQESFMGVRGLPSCDLIFEECRVPKENLIIPEGEFANLMQAFNIERLGNSAMSLGIAKGAIEESLKYSKERKQFGKEICEFQAIQLMLADMALQVEAARLLLYRAASEASKGIPSLLNTSLAKCYCNEAAKTVADLAQQIYGGYGFSKEYSIERMVRDSRAWPVAGGTVQIQRINIAAALLGRRFNHRK